MLTSFHNVTAYKPEQLTNEVQNCLLNVDNMEGADYSVSIFKILKNPGIDSKESIPCGPVQQPNSFSVPRPHT